MPIRKYIGSQHHLPEDEEQEEIERAEHAEHAGLEQEEVCRAGAYKISALSPSDSIVPAWLRSSRDCYYAAISPLTGMLGVSLCTALPDFFLFVWVFWGRMMLAALDR